MKALFITFIFVSCSSNPKSGVHLDKLQATSSELTNCNNGKILSYSPVLLKEMRTHTWVYECKGKKYNCSVGSSGRACK